MGHNIRYGGFKSSFRITIFTDRIFLLTGIFRGKGLHLLKCMFISSSVPNKLATHLAS